MLLRILIIGIVTVHLAYMAYVIFGELLTVVGAVLRWQWIRNFWFRVTHLACIAVVAAEALAGIQCPLTVWQENLEKAAGIQTSDVTFVERILNTVMFPPDLPTWVFTWIYVGFAALVALTFVVAPPRLPFRKAVRQETHGVSAVG
jgi:hypothetical protein